MHGISANLMSLYQDPLFRLPLPAQLVDATLRAIGRTATMASDLSAHRRRSSMKAISDLTNRRAGSDPSRDIFSLSESER